MGITLDLTGQRFTRLVALEKAGQNEHKRQLWLCECDCGNKLVLSSNALNRGNTRSCGCLKLQVIGERRRTHGKSNSPEYNNWMAMKSRCCNTDNQDYALYGGRGIRVCKRWANSFENFLADMGTRPPGKNTIERVNTDGHYTKDNCCWATQRQQTRNKRNNHRVTVGTRTQTIAEWAEETGVPCRTLWSRIVTGWPPEKAILNKRFHRCRKD